MSQGDRWLDERKPMVTQRQRRQERRGDGQRMDGRADVVQEAGQRELGRAHSPTDALLRLEQRDHAARPGEADRRGQPVGTGADH
jgi:hypothetical protein